MLINARAVRNELSGGGGIIWAVYVVSVHGVRIERGAFGAARWCPPLRFTSPGLPAWKRT